jgi:hypothetical protein
MDNWFSNLKLRKSHLPEALFSTLMGFLWKKEGVIHLITETGGFIATAMVRLFERPEY